MGALFVHGLIDGLLESGVYALMAVGLSLILGVMDFLNLAQAVFVVLGSYLSYTLEVHAGIDPFLGLLITMPVLFGFGMALEWLFMRKITGRDKLIVALLVTYAVGEAILGALNMIYGTNYVRLTASYVTATVHAFGMYIPQVYIFGFILAVVLVALLYAMLYGTRTGSSLRATIQNRTAARLVGIDVQRVSTIAFGVGVALAAAGGMLFAARAGGFTANSSEDLGSRLLAIVILGGLDSIEGALVGAVVMLVLEDILSSVWSPLWSTSVFYIVLVLVLLFRPRGLFGRAVY
jgi:branched-chain amino acid transport system permease protein